MDIMKILTNNDPKNKEEKEITRRLKEAVNRNVGYWGKVYFIPADKEVSATPVCFEFNTGRSPFFNPLAADIDEKLTEIAKDYPMYSFIVDYCPVSEIEGNRGDGRIKYTRFESRGIVIKSHEMEGDLWGMTM